MLATPVFDTAVFNAVDDDFDYYGWTDNITFLKNSLFGSKAATNSAISHRKMHDNGGSEKNSSVTTIENQSRRRFPTRKPLTSSNTFFDKYSEPLACDLKFNSLRSGPFGITDPLISKLFATYIPGPDFPGSERTQKNTSADLINFNDINEPLLEDDLTFTQDVFGNFEDLFAKDNSKHFITAKVQIPGEIQGVLQTSTLEKSIEIENDLFWDMPYDGDMKSISINATLIRPEQRKQKRNPLLDSNNPVYEFPGNYHKSRNSLTSSTNL